jgi:hypothetical protein
MVDICKENQLPFYREKKTWFANCQESYRKDVDRAFGALQVCFDIFW